jgi:acetyl esterase
VDLTKVEDRKLADGLRVRVYTPSDPAPKPALVYFHGGGSVLGAPETIDAPCRRLTNASGCVVVSVDYRRAPEHHFPAPAEDCYAATRYVAEHAEGFGVNPRRIAVGGDSAGGNLAAAVALMARDRGGPSLAFQLLVCPVTDYSFDSPSYRTFGRGYTLTEAAMRWYWAPSEPEIGSARASPSLKGAIPPGQPMTQDVRDPKTGYRSVIETFLRGPVPALSQISRPGAPR